MIRTWGRFYDEVAAGPCTFSYWKGEVEELRVEIVALNWKGIREEWSDVCCLLGVMLMGWGWPVRWVPILPGFGLYAARKFENRLSVWAYIFGHHFTIFKKEYLIDGGNYVKMKKVKIALWKAGITDDEVDEQWLRDTGIVTA